METISNHGSLQQEEPSLNNQSTVVASDNPILKAAEDLEAIGLIATPLNGKKPFRTSWQKEHIDRKKYPEIFLPHLNIGIRTGVTSGIVDIDADCPEVVVFLEQLLPPTNAIYGRKSRPKSHWLYSVPYSGPRKKFEDAILAQQHSVEKAMIVEYRGDDVQSMCPPSLHPEKGEGRLVWVDASFIRNQQRPIETTNEILIVACARAAIGVMRLRYTQEQIDANQKAAANMLEWQAIVDSVAEEPSLLDESEKTLSQRAAASIKKPAQQAPSSLSNKSAGGWEKTLRSSFDAYLEQLDKDDEIAYIKEALKYISSDDRDVWLLVGGALHDKLDEDGRLIWDAWSSKSVKFDIADQERTWKSFARPRNKEVKLAGIGSIIKMAREGKFVGYKYPGSNYTHNESSKGCTVGCDHAGDTSSVARHSSYQCESVRQPAADGLGEPFLNELREASAKQPRNARRNETEGDDECSTNSLSPMPLFEARPFVFKEMEYLQRRQPIYGNHYIKNYVSCDVAVGGIGKTSLILVEALAITTGLPLLGIKPNECCNVLIFNGEDPLEELDLRLHAAINYYGIKPEQINGRLFVNSGRDSELIVAGQTRDGIIIYEPLVEQLIAEIKNKSIGVVIIDPFVGSHAVSENDNGAIDRVVKLFGRIAGLTNCSVNLVHHTRKTNGNSASVEDGRGASSMLAGVRSARAFNPMSEDEASKAGVENKRQFFKVVNGKSNMFLSSDQSQWFKMESFSILNGPFGAEGDSVGVCTAWEWPNPFDDIKFDDLRSAQRAVANGGPWKRNQQAIAWVGIAVADVLGLDPTDRGVKYKLNRIMEKWIKEGVFKVTIKRDAKRREPCEFVEVGEWVT